MEWSDAAAAALSKLNDVQWGERKKATIIALVDARLAGRSEESVWDLPQVCARNTYHSKWKKDEVFVGVLDEVTTLAKAWSDGKAMRALAEAAEQLALSSPAAVRRLVKVMALEDDATNARLAAVAILDRAGMKTASKSSSENATTVELTGQQLADILRQAEDEAAAVEAEVMANGWNPVQGPPSTD